MKKNPSRNVHFSKGPSEILDAINTSIDIDQRLYKEDITGSIAHARMLGKQKIINKKEQSAIVSGLKAIERDIEKNKVVFSKKLEDIHMNIESLLFKKKIFTFVSSLLHIALYIFFKSLLFILSFQVLMQFYEELN